MLLGSWDELPNLDTIRIPVEFRDGGWLNSRQPIGSAGWELAIFNAAIWPHPAYAIVLTPDHYPATYLPCDPDVCLVAEDRLSTAFFDWDMQCYGHLLVDSLELRTFPRYRIDEFVVSVGKLDDKREAAIKVAQVIWQGREPRYDNLRVLKSTSTQSAIVYFACNSCAFRQAVPYGGPIPVFTALKFVGCPSCRQIRQVPVDVREMTNLHCDCGTAVTMYDTGSNSWVQSDRDGSYVATFPCLACNKTTLQMNPDAANTGQPQRPAKPEQLC